MNQKQTRPSASPRGARPAVRPPAAARRSAAAKAAAKAGVKAAKASKPAKAPRASRVGKETATQFALAERLRGVTSNLRLIVIIALIGLGMVILAPQAQLWFQQRQQIAQLEQQVAQAKDDLAKMKRTQQRWSDPVYIRSQARNRLYYVLPGEISYLVMGADGISRSDVSGTVGAQLAQERASSQISTSITRAKKNWVNSLMQSVVRAGIEEPTPAPTTGTGK